MNKIINYIKQNYIYCLVMLIGLFIFSIQTYYVVLYADDFSLGTISNDKGFLGAFSHMAENYMEWGGGPTPMFAVMFLCADIIVWKIFSIIIIFSMVYMIVDMVTFKNKEQRWLVASLVWLLVFIIDILISRETLYWLDGHLAYVFTTFNLLIFFYYLFKRLIIKSKFKKFDYVLLPIVAFFAGWSGPQSGAIIIVMTILLFIYKRFFLKEKIKGICYISFIIAIIGFLVYYFAPGNNVRFETGFPQIAQLNTFELIEYRIDSIFSLLFNYNSNFAGLTFYIYITFALLIIITINKILKDTNSKKITKAFVCLSAIVLIIFILASIIYRYNLMGCEYIGKLFFSFKNIYQEILNGYFNFKMLLPYIVMTIVIISSLIMSFYIFIKEKSVLHFIALACAFLTQLIMLMAPYSPVRTTFLSIILFIIAIAELLFIASRDKYNIEMATFIILTYFGINYLICGIIIFIIINTINNKKNDYKSHLLFMCVLSYFALFNIITVTDGYRVNKKIYNQNIEILRNYDGKSSEITLIKPNDETYGFTTFVGTEWVEDATKEYFNIPEDVKLMEK